MSLLIKALDKAQAEKVQAKKKDETVDQKHDERHKPLKSSENVISEDTISLETLTIADTHSELSLSPPKAPLLEETQFDLDRIPASVLDSAAVTVQREAFVNGVEKTTKEPATKPITLATKPVNNQTTQSNKQTNIGTTQAANVFAAKRTEATHQNTKLAVIIGAGLIAMLAMGAYYYQFLDDSPEVVIPPRPVAIQQTTQSELNQTQEVGEAEQPELETPAPEPGTAQTFEPQETAQLAQKNEIRANVVSQDKDEAIENNENTFDENEVVVSTSKKSRKSNSVNLDNRIASESASIEVTQAQQPTVSPTLMRAYEAYIAGHDSEAQKLYKQVLQRDISNTDAMLGLGAIATRQGRIADANGWYRKVLEIEPRNSLAQAALLEIQNQENPQANEGHIKSMLAKTPGDANLYVALGNLYAEQNLWASAQEAYFEAYRLNENAENAYNLGVSLDQMGKSKLALPYYQQALQSEISGIDKAALEARITAIQ